MHTQSHCPVPLPSFTESLPLIEGSERQITQGESHRQQTRIYALPDNVLLEIFDSCKKDLQYVTATRWKWCFLAHVCRRWRQIVFESPQRLNLQIHCTFGTPVRKSLGIWPPIPIAIDFFPYPYDDGLPPDEEDNVMAALEHPGRVCFLRLRVTRLQLEKMATVMQEPFPALTHLNISLDSQHAPVLPAEFLGGSAPCLRKFHLTGIPFPALPTLLMSASNLVFLFLQKIPPTGYISPEAMVACLAPLHRLETFVMKFQLATPHPDRIHSLPTARTLLPALTRFVFEGASEYLEDLVVQINTPQLDRIIIDYHYQLDFQVTQLSKFIDRSVGPKLRPFGHASVNFFGGQALLAMYREDDRSSPSQRSALIIVSCEASDWDFSQITQVLSEFSPSLSNVVHLELSSQPEDIAIEGTGEAEWLHLLHHFSTVKTLRVSRNLARHLALALDDITWEMVDGFLPSLDSIFLEDQPAPSIEKFLAARQLSGRPVTVIDTEMEFNEIFTL